MFASIRGGRGRLWALSVALLGLVVLACATAQAPEETGESASAHSQGSGMLSDVWVEREGAESVVTLVGLVDPVYTAFVHPDPTALVLDVNGVEVGEPAEPIAVFDGLVEQVTLSGFEGSGDAPMARVEVSLSEWADYEVVSVAEGLQIRLRSAGTDVSQMDQDESASLETSEGEDPWAEADVLAGDAEVLEASLPEPPSATRLEDVQVREAGSGVLLHLVANGLVGAIEAFTLENPARLVVDLAGLESQLKSDKVEVGLAQVESIRIGAHADKVRVVIDGGSDAGAFEGRRLMPAANGLFVTLGDDELVDLALEAGLEEANAQLAATATSVTTTSDTTSELGFDEPVALDETLEASLDESADEAELAGEETLDEIVPIDLALDEAAQDSAAPAQVAGSGGVSVHGIHFDSQAEKDRVVVLGEGPIDYVIHTPDPETAVVSLPGASIPREAEGRITPPSGGPVSLVTAFRQPDVDEVRIVVKRAPGVEPQVSRHGTMLFIDFENTGVAASAPPAFTGGPQAVMTTAAADTASATSASQASAEEISSFELDGGAALDSGPGEELAGADLPQFSQPAALSGTAGFEDDLVVTPSAAATGSGGPASLEPPAAVEVLVEGGLIDGKEYKGRRISLDFKDVEIADVLRIIAEVSDLNIVAGEEVEGSVTIRLVDVPWDQALDVILLTKGLGFVRVGNVLRIAPSDILAQEEEFRLQERRNKEKLEDLVVKLQPVNYGAVKDVSTLVKRLLSARGTVNIDERTNTLIIKDIASVVDEASALVKAIDTQTPQVLIEAKIVEANLDFSRELGASWRIATNPLTDGFDPSSAPRRDLGNSDFLFNNENSVIFANPITSVATGLATLNAFVLDEKMDINVQLAAAESSGDGKVISSPRVVTLDNREAEISQGVSIPFQTFENGDAKLEFIDAVLRLKVTPHITSDKSIIMTLEVTRNAPDDSVQTPTGSPAIAKNEAKTETLVKDGQTLVIGGIYTITKTQRESRVPYLHSIPVIGNAFKSREITDLRKELLIFITPRVVVQPS